MIKEALESLDLARTLPSYGIVSCDLNDAISATIKNREIAEAQYTVESATYQMADWIKRAIPYLEEVYPMIVERAEMWKDRSRAELYLQDLRELEALLREVNE